MRLYHRALCGDAAPCKSVGLAPVKMLMLQRSSAVASSHTDKPRCRSAGAMTCTFMPGQSYTHTKSIAVTMGSKHHIRNNMDEADELHSVKLYMN